MNADCNECRLDAGDCLIYVEVPYSPIRCFILVLGFDLLHLIELLLKFDLLHLLSRVIREMAFFPPAIPGYIIRAEPDDDRHSESESTCSSPLKPLKKSSSRSSDKSINLQFLLTYWVRSHLPDNFSHNSAFL